ncbi:uncharacterized protein VTP21DRAFT_2086 [Calcarisporiella thermophila]|uniref:uncharacterized protein n=1 Tax=Calcarisporiella thermophila TaxID=911321 RepID=UPI0037423BD1
MPETDEEKQRRFEIELEFVQCLSNPWYLNYLAQLEYLKDPAFINYLEYLQYWKRPEYAKFIIYPHALYFLDLLQYPSFRDALITQEAATFIHKTQYWHWRYYRNPQTLLQEKEEQQPTAENESQAPNGHV